MTRTIFTKKTELVIDSAEISQAKSGDVFVIVGGACNKGELGGRFGGLAGGPDDIRGLDGSMGKVIDGGEFGNI